MNIIDCHTHDASANDAIINLDRFSDAVNLSLFYSAGIHPWNAENATESLFSRLEQLLQLVNVVAVGECGIDKAIATPIDVQQSVMMRQVELSEKYEKTLIVHCVRAWQEIIDLHKSIKPSQKWIIHGFRAKPTVLEALLKEDLFIAYGPLFNAQSLVNTPLNRLLIETDESHRSIDEVSQSVSDTLGISASKLIMSVSTNICQCFKFPQP